MNEEAIKDLITYISEKAEKKDNWKIHRDEILETLNLDIRDVYEKIIRSDNPLISFSHSEYDHRDVGAIICLLECFGFKSSEEAFSEAGLWISFEIQIELQNRLVDIITQTRNEHQIDFESFLRIFDRFENLHRSLEIYLEEYFPWKPIIEAAVDSFDKGKDLLRKLAYEQLRRNIVPYWNLFTSVFTELRAFLISKGRIEEPQKPKKKLDDKLKAALQVLALDNQEKLNVKELKDRYKELMKKYHPDVNPRGLEKAQEITTAYSFILSSL